MKFVKNIIVLFRNVFVYAMELYATVYQNEYLLHLERLHTNSYKNVMFDTTHALFYDIFSLCNIRNMYFNDQFPRNTILNSKLHLKVIKKCFFLEVGLIMMNLLQK